MVILLQLALGLAAIGMLSSLLLRRRRAAKRAALLERRVQAYMQTIRREGRPEALAEMTDEELRDLLLGGAEELVRSGERDWFILLGAAIVAFALAIFYGTEEGVRGFAAGLALGALVIYGLGRFLERRRRRPLEALGIDADRLRIGVPD